MWIAKKILQLKSIETRQNPPIEYSIIERNHLYVNGHIKVWHHVYSGKIQKEFDNYTRYGVY